MAKCTCKKWGCESDCICNCHREAQDKLILNNGGKMYNFTLVFKGYELSLRCRSIKAILQRFPIAVYGNYDIWQSLSKS